MFVGQNGSVSHTGKRVGPRRKRGFSPALLLLSIGVTLCVVAWGYLVKAAIDFGSTAREGDQDAWWFLGVASLGAVACLFVALMLASRILRRLGITRPDGASAEAPREPSFDTTKIPPVTRGNRPVGGHRR
jgi:hypothetical protein